MCFQWTVQVSKYGHLPQLLSSLHNPPGTIKFDLSSQHDVSATWKLSEKMDQAGVNKLPNAVQLRAVGSRKTKGLSFEAVSYCDLAQNLETVQFLISKNDLDNSFFSRYRYSWWLTQLCHSCYSYVPPSKVIVLYSLPILFHLHQLFTIWKCII